MGDQNCPNYTSLSLAVQIAIPISSGNGARLSTLIAAGTLLTAVNLPSWCTTTFGSPGLPAVAMTNLQQCQQIAMRTMGVIIEYPSAAFNTDWIAAMTNQVARANNTLFQTIGAVDGARRTFVRSNAAAFNAVAVCLCCGEQLTSIAAL
jgi:hypothetical protein